MAKDFWLCLLALLLGFCLGIELFGYDLEVYFTPGSDPVPRMVELIGKARKKIKVQAYHFTDERIAKALIEKQKQGVQVYIIMDRAGAASQYNVATLCQKEGCTVRVDDYRIQIAHNKVIVIDDGTQWASVIQGSYNFTEGANKRNAENVLMIFPPYNGNEKEIIEQYAGNWMSRWDNTKHYDPKKPKIVPKPKPKPKPSPRPSRPERKVSLSGHGGNVIDE